jgi:hypothetical protein
MEIKKLKKEIDITKDNYKAAFEQAVAEYQQNPGPFTHAKVLSLSKLVKKN